MHEAVQLQSQMKLQELQNVNADIQNDLREKQKELTAMGRT